MPEKEQNPLFRANTAQINRSIDRFRDKIRKYFQSEPVQPESSESTTSSNNIKFESMPEMEVGIDNVPKYTNKYGRTRTLGTLGSYLHVKDEVRQIEYGGIIQN